MSPGAPPRLVYDDDCGVCTRAALFVARHADVELVGFSALTPDQRARLPADWERCAHLLTDDAVHSCGEAMVRAFERTGLPPARLLPWLRRVPGYGRARELVYRAVADNRDLLGRLL
jgi:predicted DCC family thiol-disulfide oxidoreductase YuxK